jgi:hypothetical protein
VKWRKGIVDDEKKGDNDLMKWNNIVFSLFQRESHQLSLVGNELLARDLIKPDIGGNWVQDPGIGSINYAFVYSVQLRVN